MHITLSPRQFTVMNGDEKQNDDQNDENANGSPDESGGDQTSASGKSKSKRATNAQKPHGSHPDGKMNPVDDDSDGTGNGSNTKPGDQDSDQSQPEWTPEEIDRVNQQAISSSTRSEEIATVEGMKSKNSKDEKSNGVKQRGGPSQAKDGDPVNVWEKVKATISWSQLLSKLIGSAPEIEETYRKASRKSVSSAHQVAHSGKAVIKPGEVEEEAKLKKIVFVIDCSGSMFSTIAKVYASVEKLIKQHYQSMAVEFVLIKYSGDYHIYQCRQQGGRGSYKEIASAAKIRRGTKLDNGNIAELFKSTINGGTNFGNALVSEIEVFLKDKYNVLILTDPDIVVGSNLVNLKRLYKKYSRQVYVIADTIESFRTICQVFGEVTQNMSHL